MFGWGKPRRPKAVAFDIIETVFPLDPMRPSVIRLGLPPSGLEAVYASALRDAFALSAAGDFKPFTAVMGGALDQVLGEQGLSVPSRAKAALIKQMDHLPARPDAREAFGIIVQAGMAVVALSNGSAASTRRLLRAAQLDDLVRHVVSVDEVELFKPRREVYAHAADKAGVKPRHMALVAVHPWDINGAKAARLTTGYVTAVRPFSSAMRPPDVEGPTLAAVARRLAAL